MLGRFRRSPWRFTLHVGITESFMLMMAQIKPWFGIIARRRREKMNNPPHKYFVRITDTNYPVRITETEREIFYNNTWMSTDTFVDKLIEENELDKVTELAKLGYALQKEAKA
jgi:hypothetical protein